MSCERKRGWLWAAALVLVALTSARPALADDEEELEKRGARGPVLAFEIGYGGLAGGGGTVYGAGMGKAFILGYRLGPTTFEWHFSQSYRMTPGNSVLQGASTEGSLGLSTVGIRYSRQRRGYVLSGFAGVTRSSIPLLSLITEYGETTVERRDLAGVGGVGGLGFAIPIRRGQVQVGVELRAAYAVWERPGAPYVAEVESAGADTVTFTEATDDVDAIPWTLAFAMRALL